MKAQTAHFFFFIDTSCRRRDLRFVVVSVPSENDLPVISTFVVATALEMASEIPASSPSCKTEQTHKVTGSEEAGAGLQSGAKTYSPA